MPKKKPEWLKVAIYDSEGPFRGRVVPLKKVQGRHRWKIEVSARRPALLADGSRRRNAQGELEDEKQTFDIVPSDVCELYALKDKVFESIAELAEWIIHSKLHMDFYIKTR